MLELAAEVEGKRPGRTAAVANDSKAILGLTRYIYMSVYIYICICTCI